MQKNAKSLLQHALTAVTTTSFFWWGDGSSRHDHHPKRQHHGSIWLWSIRTHPQKKSPKLWEFAWSYTQKQWPPSSLQRQPLLGPAPGCRHRCSHGKNKNWLLAKPPTPAVSFSGRVLCKPGCFWLLFVQTQCNSAPSKSKNAIYVHALLHWKSLAQLLLQTKGGQSGQNARWAVSSQRQTDRQTDRPTDRQTDRQTGRQADWQTDRQTGPGQGQDRTRTGTGQDQTGTRQDRTDRQTYVYDIHTIPHHNTPLHCLALHYITLHYITLHYITLHYITLHTLHYITLHHITLHYITIRNITLHYITLHTCVQTCIMWYNVHTCICTLHTMQDIWNPQHNSHNPQSTSHTTHHHPRATRHMHTKQHTRQRTRIHIHKYVRNVTIVYLPHMNLAQSFFHFSHWLQWALI